MGLSEKRAFLAGCWETGDSGASDPHQQLGHWTPKAGAPTACPPRPPRCTRSTASACVTPTAAFAPHPGALTAHSRPQLYGATPATTRGPRYPGRGLGRQAGLPGAECWNREPKRQGSSLPRSLVVLIRQVVSERSWRVGGPRAPSRLSCVPRAESGGCGTTP